jgi:soluble calcium-activated nucleotidase 1
MLTYNAEKNRYTAEMMANDDKTVTLTTKHNEDGRGAEFSELTFFDNKHLITVDDRTGGVFEIISSNDNNNHDDQSSPLKVVPRHLITEGNGDTDKGMKWEWSTTKDDDQLVMGSTGTIFYDRVTGEVKTTNNLWIAVMDRRGNYERENWSQQYEFVRRALLADALGCSDAEHCHSNIPSKGYVSHEAVLWSSHHNRWVFVPRRISLEPYTRESDETNGTPNKVVLVNEDFTSYDIVTLDLDLDDDDTRSLRGFSSIAFVPGTNDKHVAAIRSVEHNCYKGSDQVCKQRSYMTVFDLKTGNVLMNEIEIDSTKKFEGLEFVNVLQVSSSTMTATAEKRKRRTI